MNDNEIVELFFQRNPDGIQAAQEKYGAYCLAVARNILGGEEDSQECLNDLWLRAWNAIPPQRPKLLKAWLGKVIRNLAINCREKAAAQKRPGARQGPECLPGNGSGSGPENLCQSVLLLRDYGPDSGKAGPNPGTGEGPAAPVPGAAAEISAVSGI